MSGAEADNAVDRQTKRPPLARRQTAMIPRGEVGPIFAEPGRISGIFTNEIYAGMIIVIALTTLLLPFVMK